MAYIIRVFDPKAWQLSFNCTPYNTYPKKCQTLKAWNNESKADLTINLAYFNFDTSYTRQQKAVYRTLQFLRIAKLGGDCAYGGTAERIRLPNGDLLSGFSLGILDGVVKELDTKTKRSRNAFGMTTDGKYFSIQSTTKVTLNAICKYANSKLKVSIMLMNDGGGSTGCYSRRSGILFAPEKEGANGRAVASVLEVKYVGDKIKRTLKVGCVGEDVKLLQTMLGNVECDGIFGTGTRAAVRTAQANNHIAVDGIAGAITFSVLGI